MNKVIIMGRLTRDPEIRSTTSGMTIASYTLAVDRRTKKSADKKEQETDFIRCVAFDKAAQFAEKYFSQGQRVLVTGRIQTGSYEKNGQKVYTVDVIVEEQEFADTKAAANTQPAQPAGEGFMKIPDGIEEEGLPFS